MPRRGYTPLKELRPDPKYNSILLSRFINALMRKGKKSVAERIMYDSIDMISKRTGEDGVNVVKQAVEDKLGVGKSGFNPGSILVLPGKIIEGTFKGLADMTVGVISGTINAGKVAGKTIEDSFKK